MRTIEYARRALAALGIMTNADRADRIHAMLRERPPTDPTRRRVEQLLQLARERRDRARHA